MSTKSNARRSYRREWERGGKRFSVTSSSVGLEIEIYDGERTAQWYVQMRHEADEIANAIVDAMLLMEAP